MPKALVVDDSRAVRMILARTLKGLGFETAEAGDGRQALDLIQRDRSQWNLVLADWNMPVMNGLDLLRNVRQDPGLDSVVVVMVTTETDIDQMATALDAGANEYIMKPFTTEILLGKLQLAGVTV
jgi:two-component system chemotaxis response regulator CheY